MKGNNLNQINDFINYDLQTLDKGKGKENKIKSKELKNSYLSLKKEIDEYISNDDLKPNYLSFLNEYASLKGKSLSFLLKNDKEYKLDNETISILKTILKENNMALTSSNYLEISKTLEPLIIVLEKLKDIIPSDLKEQYILLKYQIYKHNITNLVYTKTDYEIFLPFVTEDINNILKNPNISENLKKVLERYLLDQTLLIDNFNKVLLLINLGQTKKDISAELLTNEPNKVLYNTENIQKIVITPSKEDNKQYTKLSKKYKKLEKEEYHHEIIKSILETENLNLLYLYLSDNSSNMEFIIKELKDQTDLTLIFRLLFTKVKDIVSNALLFRETLDHQSLNYNYEIDCAIISNLDIIPDKDLLKYIMATNNKYLIRYAFKGHKKTYFLELLLKEKSIPKDPEFLSLIIDKYIPLEELLTINLEISEKELIVDSYLSLENKSNLEKYEFLLSNYFKEGSLSKDYLLEKIMSFNDRELILKLLLKIEDYNKCLDIIYNISSTELKSNVINYISNAILTNNTFNFLIRPEVIELIQNNSEIVYTKNFIDDLNEFEAKYVESKYKDSLLIYFVSKFYNSSLNWEVIIKNSFSLNKEDKHIIYNYFYQGNKKEFKKMLSERKFEIDSNFASSLIRNDVNNISYVIAYLNNEDILKLPYKTLKIFLTSYRKSLKNTTLSKRINVVLNSKNIGRIKELLTYVIEEGLMNKEIIRRYNEIKDYKELIIKGIEKAKSTYLRPSFLLKIAKFEDETFYEKYSYLIFLSAEELKNLKKDYQSEAVDIKKRQYYGDLLKFLPKVGEKTQFRIVTFIARSDIEEYQNFIKVNYPEYSDIIFNNNEKETSNI